MAPLPDNNTNRLFVDYTGSMGPRTMQFRVNDGITSAEAATRIRDFCQAALSTVWHVATQTTAARWQAANQNFSVPVSFPQVVGTVAGTLAPESYPRFFSFVGRGSIIGRRVRLYVFGSNLAVSSNYRLSIGEQPPVGPLIAALEGLRQQGCFRTIGNEAPTLQQYLNTGISAYYQRKVRA